MLADPSPKMVTTKLIGIHLLHNHCFWLCKETVELFCVIMVRPALNISWCVSKPGWIACLLSNRTDRCISSIVTQSLGDVPHVLEIIQVLLDVSNVQIWHIELHPCPRLEECVKEIIACIDRQLIALLTNYFCVVTSIHITGDVASTSLYGSPVKRQILSTLLGCLHGIWHLIVCNPITAVRDVLAIKACQKLDLVCLRIVC